MYLFHRPHRNTTDFCKTRKGKTKAKSLKLEWGASFIHHAQSEWQKDMVVHYCLPPPLYPAHIYPYPNTRIHSSRSIMKMAINTYMCTVCICILCFMLLRFESPKPKIHLDESRKCESSSASWLRESQPKKMKLIFLSSHVFLLIYSNLYAQGHLYHNSDHKNKGRKSLKSLVFYVFIWLYINLKSSSARTYLNFLFTWSG